MSHFDYEASKNIALADPPFYALIMAALRKADTANTAKLWAMWPETCAEFENRYHAPGGILPSEVDAL